MLSGFNWSEKRQAGHRRYLYDLIGRQVLECKRCRQDPNDKLRKNGDAPENLEWWLLFEYLAAEMEREETEVVGLTGRSVQAEH
jgi:hypothetical protein